MFIARFPSITKKYKQPKFPSTNEWNKIRHIHTIESYESIKKSIYTYWNTDKLKSIMPSEKSQMSETTCYIMLFIWNVHKNQTYEIRK